MPPRVVSTRLMRFGSHRCLNDEVSVADDIEPQEHPQGSDDRDALESHSPTPGLGGQDREHDDRCQDRTDACTALEHAVSHRPALPTQESLGGL